MLNEHFFDIAILTLGCVFLALFLFPYVVYPITLSLFRTTPTNPAALAHNLKITLVFAAYNEERSLPQKIANLREIKEHHPDIEILAYCDLSSDRTAEILTEASDILRPIIAEKRTGKATGMARMAKEATGDVFVFTDANVILAPESIDRIRHHFSDPEVGGLAGTLIYTNDNDSATAHVGGIYWRHEELIKRRESACGSIMGADGSIFATRGELYPPVPPHLLDDMIVSMSVPLAGKRLIFADDVIAYEKNATAASDEFRRKRRIACRAFNTHCYLWPQVSRQFGTNDIYKYISHKLLRWFGFPLLVLGIALITYGIAKFSLEAAGAFVALGALVMVLGSLNVSPFNRLMQVFMAILATFVGVVDSWRGKTYQTWNPAVSRD